MSETGQQAEQSKPWCLACGNPLIKTGNAGRLLCVTCVMTYDSHLQWDQMRIADLGAANDKGVSRVPERMSDPVSYCTRGVTEEDL